MKPVRVCFLIDQLTRAGTESQLVALIRHLDRGLVQPYLCLLRAEDEESRSLAPAACPVLHLGVRSLASVGAVRGAARLWKLLRKEQIEVLQVYFPESTYLGVPVGWLAGVRHLVRTRNNLGYWMTPLHRLLGRVCNWLAPVTIANSEACRQAVIADERLAPERVAVLENGVDVERFPTARSARGSGRRVGVVANLRPVKGLDVFLRAAAHLARSHADVRFAIAGEGPQRPELEQLAARLGMTDRLEMLGPVEDVPGFLATLDVAVLSSRSEGMSNALLEYMAAARPIVATNVGGNPRLIDHGVHGLLVAPDDVPQLTNAIRQLLDEPQQAHEYGMAARHRVEEAFSRQAMVRRFEQFYIELARGNARRLHRPEGAAVLAN